MVTHTINPLNNGNNGNNACSGFTQFSAIPPCRFWLGAPLKIGFIGLEVHLRMRNTLFPLDNDSNDQRIGFGLCLFNRMVSPTLAAGEPQELNLRWDPSRRARVVHESLPHREMPSGGCPSCAFPVAVRSIFLLTLRLLRLLESNFLGNSLWAWEFHPLQLRLCLSQTLWNP